MATSSPWLIFSDHYPEILIATVCFIVFSLLRSASSSSKDSLPYKWPIFGMLPEIIYNKQFNELVTARLRETGWTFVFKGPWIVKMDRIVTCDPANMNHMFNLNFDNYPKGDLYKVFDIFGNNLFNADGDNWYNHRIMAQTVFWDGNYRARQAKLVLDKVDSALIPILDSAACRRKPFDLQDVLLRFTFDISCQCVLDSDLGTLSSEFPTVPFAKACDEALDATLRRHITPPHIWKMKRFLNIGSEKIRADSWKVVDAYIFERIAKIKENVKRMGKNTNYNATALYIDSCDLLNDQQLRDNAYTFLLVQRNTLALTMAWLFYALSLTPRVVPKILDELQSILDKSSERRFKDGYALFDGDMIQSAIYLHATLCEVLRYYPPVPFEIKDALNADVLPSGHKVRAGEKILFSPYAMARMKGIWGDDCMEFKPERWITENGTLKHEPAYKFFAFSAGPRICLGKELAFNQMKIAVANIIYNFDVQMVKGHVVEQRTAILMEMMHGLMVEVRKRSVV